MGGIGNMTPEEAAALEAEGAANTAANQAAFDQSQADAAAAPPTNYNTGPSSYVNNAQAQAYNTIDELFPPGWGQPGETPEGTTWNNAAESLWLPLQLPPEADGYVNTGPWGNFANKPHGVFYADTRTGVVDNAADKECGEAHASPEVDACRVAVAERFALDAAKVTGGTGAGVREVPA